MGTSGSYGGSTKQTWKDARQQVLDLRPPTSDRGDGDGQPSDEAPLSELWGLIGDALVSDDPTLSQPTVDDGRISIPSLMPWLGTSSAGSGRSGGGGGGGGGAIRTGGGRQGGGSRRQVTRSAARGGTALGAAYAVRQGDAAYLGELGLDLARLRGLSPVRQCAEILDAVLGEGSHPDDQALRKASLACLKEVLVAGTAPEPAEALRTFVGSYVFELMLVELQRQVNEGAATPQEVARKEGMIKGYIDRRVISLDVPEGSTLQPRDLRATAVALTKEAMKVIRARRGGAE